MAHVVRRHDQGGEVGPSPAVIRCLRLSLIRKRDALEQLSKHSNSGPWPRCENLTSVPLSVDVISKMISVPVHSLGSSKPSRWESTTCQTTILPGTSLATFCLE